MFFTGNSSEALIGGHLHACVPADVRPEAVPGAPHASWCAAGHSQKVLEHESRLCAHSARVGRSLVVVDDLRPNPL